MPLPRRAFINPAPQLFDLRRREFLAGLRRRHDFVRIWIRYPPDQFALVAVAGDDPGLAFPHSERAFLDIQPELGLARLFIRPVAGEAVIRADGADVAVEIHRTRRGRADGFG